MNIVADYMTKDVVSIDGNDSLEHAVAVMKKSAIGSLLVTENSVPVGIFTERDLLTKVDFNNPSVMGSLKIKDIMSHELKTVNHADSYVNTIEMMQRHHIRHMPVVRSGAIIGIVSLRDLLNHYYENLERLFNDTVAALSSAVEKRDPYTAGHQARVTRLSCAIARAMGLSNKKIDGVNMAALVHDIGKVYVPSEILSKPGKLTEAEFMLVKIHPQVGYDILKHVDFPWPVAQAVLQHHERLDGSGYPNHLQGQAIILEARIVGVADVVEAMASHRPYHVALGIDEALKEIGKSRGILYDEVVVDACLELFRKKEFNFEQGQGS